MSLRDDKLFVLWEASLKPKTAATYRFRLMKLYEIVHKTPTQRIEEAREELSELDPRMLLSMLLSMKYPCNGNHAKA